MILPFCKLSLNSSLYVNIRYLIPKTNFYKITKLFMLVLLLLLFSSFIYCLGILFLIAIGLSLGVLSSLKFADFKIIYSLAPPFGLKSLAEAKSKREGLLFNLAKGSFMSNLFYNECMGRRKYLIRLFLRNNGKDIELSFLIFKK